MLKVSATGRFGIHYSLLMMQTLTRAATSPALDRVSKRTHTRTRKNLQRSHQLRPLLLNDQQGRTELEIRLMSRFCLNARSGNSPVGRIVHEGSTHASIYQLLGWDASSYTEYRLSRNTLHKRFQLCIMEFPKRSR